MRDLKGEQIMANQDQSEIIKIPLGKKVYCTFIALLCFMVALAASKNQNNYTAIIIFSAVVLIIGVVVIRLSKKCLGLFLSDSEISYKTALTVTDTAVPDFKVKLEDVELIEHDTKKNLILIKLQDYKLSKQSPFFTYSDKYTIRNNLSLPLEEVLKLLEQKLEKYKHNISKTS
jgi:hypothetical protein